MAAIYAGSLSALLGVSALYHRINWRRPEIRRWMRRLDHSMIFLLIAGTVTPFAVLVLGGALGDALLIAVWAGAAAGIVVEMVWVEAPKWVAVIVYLAVGWIGALGFPAIVIKAGLGAGILIAVGGILYTAGAVVYARQRPDPNPAVFGYHEIFHAPGDRGRRVSLRRGGDLRAAGLLGRRRRSSAVLDALLGEVGELGPRTTRPRAPRRSRRGRPVTARPPRPARWRAPAPAARRR